MQQTESIFRATDVLAPARELQSRFLPRPRLPADGVEDLSVSAVETNKGKMEDLSRYHLNGESIMTDEGVSKPSSALPGGEGNSSTTSIFSGWRPKKKSAPIDDLLNSKLNNMSLEERSNGLHDLHGVASLEKESSEMMQSKLREIDQAVATTTLCKIAYEKAVSMSLEYVQEIKLKCLRAQCYDSQDSADQLIRHFTRKMELFAEDKLVKEITQEDLDPADIVALKNGLFQILPERDRSGRAIVMYVRKGNSNYSTKSVLRVLHYVAMSVLQDEEIQRRGIVVIGYGFGEAKFVPNRPFELWKSWRATPARVTALHSCRSDVNQFTNYLLCSVMESGKLSRFRRHIGTPLECIYALMTFGIPRDAIPADDDGVIDLTRHHSMLEVMKKKEKVAQQQMIIPQISKKSSPVVLKNSKNNNRNVASAQHGNVTSRGGRDSSNRATAANDIQSNDKKTEKDNNDRKKLVGAILVPGHMDIIMGRGRHPKSSPGALRMHHLLLQHRTAHENAKSRSAKTAISKSILNQMKALGCRFLVLTRDGYYVESDDLMAREKIAHGFRNLRLKDRSGGGDSTRCGSGGGSNGSDVHTEGADGATYSSQQTETRKRDLPWGDNR